MHIFPTSAGVPRSRIQLFTKQPAASTDTRTALLKELRAVYAEQNALLQQLAPPVRRPAPATERPQPAAEVKLLHVVAEPRWKSAPRVERRHRYFA